MRNSFKYSALMFISVVLFLLIFVVDAVFYRVPSFIRLYGNERELAVIVAFLLLIPFLKNTIGRITDIRKRLQYLAVCAILLPIIIILPQILFRRFLVLWDSNPFLAEFPLAWNIAMSLLSVPTGIILIVILFLLHGLILHEEKKYTRPAFRIFLIIIAAMTAGLNIFQNRYAFQPLSIPIPEFNAGTVLLLTFVAVVFIFNSYRNIWIDELNKREKYIAFTIGLIILPLLVLLDFSRFITPAYAYSISLKGFVLVVLNFTIVYFAVNVISLLIRLPMAAYHDRMAAEIANYGKVSQMINSGHSVEEIITAITEYGMNVTRSDAAWIEIGVPEKNSPAVFRVQASANLSDEIVARLDNRKDNTFSSIMLKHRKPVMIQEAGKDERILYLRIVGLKYQSYLAVPLVENETVVGVLYVAKKMSFGYRKHDIDTLLNFLMQVRVALEFQWKHEQPKPETENLQEFSECKKSNIDIFADVNLNGFQISGFCCDNPVPDQYQCWNFIKNSNAEYLIYHLKLNSDKKAIIEKQLAEINGSLKTFFQILDEPAEIISKAMELFSDSQDTDMKALFLGHINIAEKRIAVANFGEHSVLHFSDNGKTVNVFRGLIELELNIKNSDHIIFLNHVVTPEIKKGINAVIAENPSNNLDELNKKILSIYTYSQTERMIKPAGVSIKSS